MEFWELGIVVRRGGEGGEATGNFLAILRGVPALVYTFHRIYFSSGSLAIEIFGT